jgi:hypothetical protein
MRGKRWWGWCISAPKKRTRRQTDALNGKRMGQNQDDNGVNRCERGYLGGYVRTTGERHTWSNLFVLIRRERKRCGYAGEVSLSRALQKQTGLLKGTSETCCCSCAAAATRAGSRRERTAVSLPPLHVRHLPFSWGGLDWVLRATLTACHRPRTHRFYGSNSSYEGYGVNK